MIRDAFAFIACVSENYQDSRMCRREIKYADSLGKSIVPVSQTEWAWGEGLRMMFQELQVLDLNQGAELPRLGVVVRRLLHA